MIEHKNSLKHIDELIAEKKKYVKDKEMLDYVELLFIRATMVSENIATAVKDSFDKITEEYRDRFDEIRNELQGLRKDLGYSNGGQDK